MFLAFWLPAAAQEPALERGDAVVTGFSGIQPSTDTPPAGANPLDYFFIDIEGPSAQVFALSGFGRAAEGQLATTPPKRTIKAGEVGQVFAVTLDDGLGAATSNIYLGATSVYGIQIVAPGVGGGPPKRLRRGRANAAFMPGQFGPGPSGNPGTIWRVDGKTGTVSAFATLPGNSGPGIGAIVFDPTTRHFYASDLDTGLVQRIDVDGVLVDSFDHGVSGRPTKGLATMADNGKVMDITSPAFKTNAPVTWGYTQPGRRVWGLAIRDGRLYYAVVGGLQIWSIALDDKGGFTSDVRWEFDATALKGKGPITNMLFDQAGRLSVAQRGEQRAAYNFGSFVAPGRSSVARFTRDDSGAWQGDAETYAVGMVGNHNYADGGIALGYGYNPDGTMKLDQCGATLWATGSRMREGQNPTGAPGGDPVASDVHGIQGVASSAVRPSNAPPTQSYFVDYDGILGDGDKAGHVGAIATWHSCDGGNVEVAQPGLPAGPGDGQLPPGYVPPGEEPPPELPPVFPPPEVPYNANLQLTKRALPQSCFVFGPGWACKFEIRVRNTGSDPYNGPLMIAEQLPAAPAGALMGFSPSPPWNCWNVGPSSYRCLRPGTVLAPNASVGLTSLVWVPNTYAQCFVQNTASILWAPPGTQWNSDPTDDIASATALVPSPACPPPVGPTNLTLTKSADPTDCLLDGGDVVCRFEQVVTNAGANTYSAPVQIYDEPGNNATATFGPGPWNCVANGVGYDCTHPATTLFPTQQLIFWSWVRMPIDAAQAVGCQFSNEAWITDAPGGTPPNLNPGDDYGSAAVVAPVGICVAAANNQEDQCPVGFVPKNGNCEAIAKPLPVVTPPKPIGCPVDMQRVRRADVRKLRRAGWVLIRQKTGQWCGRPGVRPPPPPPPPPVDACPPTMSKVPAWRVAQLRRDGWLLMQLPRTKIWCGRPGRERNPCRAGERLVTSSGEAARLRKLGARLRRVSWRGRRAWCAGPIAGPPICQGGKLQRRGRGWFCACPRNTRRQPVGNRGGAICLPGIPPKVCKANEDHGAHESQCRHIEVARTLGAPRRSKTVVCIEAAVPVQAGLQDDQWPLCRG